MPLLEPFNPGDREVFHAVFVGGANMPARIVSSNLSCGSRRGTGRTVAGSPNL